MKKTVVYVLDSDVFIAAKNTYYAFDICPVLAAASLEDAEQQDAEGDEDDAHEKVLAAVMASRGRQKNLSYFAFTATPKAKTLELFGTRDAEGKPRPFHLYSMRQAIEEGFILDVLKNYTTYKAYYRLVKATENDPRVPKKEATRQLARFMSLHPHNIAQKTEVMVEHFRAKVRHKLGGRAKAMLVTSSRLLVERLGADVAKRSVTGGKRAATTRFGTTHDVPAAGPLDPDVSV